MEKVVIALLLVFSLTIQKIESNVSNDQLLLKLQNFHLKIKKQMQIIVHEPYETTRKKITKWIFFLLATMVLLISLSISIYGQNSVNNLLHDKRLLFLCYLAVILIIGRVNRKMMYIINILLIISGVITIYLIHTKTVFIILDELPDMNLLTQDIMIALFVLIISVGILLITFSARLISYLLYLLIKLLFRLCIYLFPEKPLKPFILIIDLSFILGLSILGLFK